VSFERELCRLAQLLIERVVIADGGLEIIWHDHGWRNWGSLPIRVECHGRLTHDAHA